VRRATACPRIDIKLRSKSRKHRPALAEKPPRQARAFINIKKSDHFGILSLSLGRGNMIGIGTGHG